MGQNGSSVLPGVSAYGSLLPHHQGLHGTSRKTDTHTHTQVYYAGLKINVLLLQCLLFPPFCLVGTDRERLDLIWSQVCRQVSFQLKNAFAAISQFFILQYILLTVHFRSLQTFVLHTKRSLSFCGSHSSIVMAACQARELHHSHVPCTLRQVIFKDVTVFRCIHPSLNSDQATSLT